MWRKVPFSAIVAVSLVLVVPAIVFALPASTFEGRPDFSAGSELGAFVWHDSEGLHVRVTTKGKTHTFTGKVCSKRIAKLHPANLEAEDTVSIGPKGHCVLFKLTNHGGIDGFDLRIEGPEAKFSIELNGHMLDANRIWIGSGNVHPAHNPFVLTR